MNKQELIAALEDGRKQFHTVIQGLSDEAMVEPGVVGDWSLKDVLAHLSRWEAELVALLHQAQQGREPETVHFGSASADELNAKWNEESKDRPLEQLLSDFEGVRRQTIRSMQPLSDRDLTDPKRFAWLDGKPLWSWIQTDSFGHEAEHAAQIRAWRERRAENSRRV